MATTASTCSGEPHPTQQPAFDAVDAENRSSKRQKLSSPTLGKPQRETACRRLSSQAVRSRLSFGSALGQDKVCVLISDYHLLISLMLFHLAMYIQKVNEALPLPIEQLNPSISANQISQPQSARCQISSTFAMATTINRPFESNNNLGTVEFNSRDLCTFMMTGKKQTACPRSSRAVLNLLTVHRGLTTAPINVQ